MKTLSRSVAILGAAMLFCACHFHLFHQQPVPRGWIPITTRDGEPPGYHTYTYVIFGLPPQDAEAKTQQVARTRALLKAILATSAPQPGGTPLETLADANLFCFPANSDQPGRESQIDNYNRELGDLYRGNYDFRLRVGHRARLIGIKLEHNAGPFLVTVLAPMRMDKETEPILVTELTETNPDKMKEVVAAYQQPPAQSEAGKSAEAASQFLQRLSQRLTKAEARPMLWIPQTQ